MGSDRIQGIRSNIIQRIWTNNSDTIMVTKWFETFNNSYDNE